jgi:rapamycin-insensitive companion of mTOR
MILKHSFVVYRKTRRNIDPKQTEVSHKQQDTLKLTDQYIGLLILIFNSAGLMDVCH